MIRHGLVLNQNWKMGKGQVPHMVKMKEDVINCLGEDTLINTTEEIGG